MASVLTIAEGRDKGRVYEFDLDAVTIGRASGNNVVLFDPGVSRLHARIVQRDGRHFVVDNGSANGTIVNGTAVRTEQELRTGDRIGIGPFTFSFVAKAASPIAASKKPFDDGATRVSGTLQRGIAASPATVRTTMPAAMQSGVRSVLLRLSQNQRTAGFGIAFGVIVLAAVMVARSNSGSTKTACPDVIELSENMDPGTFGDGAVDYACGRKVVFGFHLPERTRAYFHYTPVRVKADAVQVTIGGKAIGTLGGARKEDQELLLSGAGAGSVLISLESSVDDWAIDRVRLELVGLIAPDRVAAKKYYDLGLARWEARNIAPSNTFEAWKALREARRYVEFEEPHPPLYAAIVGQMRDAEREMDRSCKKLLFTANRHEKYDEADKAQLTYQQILLYFPDNDPSGCRKIALENLPSGTSGSKE